MLHILFHAKDTLYYYTLVTIVHAYLLAPETRYYYKYKALLFFVI